MDAVRRNYGEDLIKDEEGLIFNPYNPSNAEITLNDVQSILTEHGVPYQPRNLGLYKRAFVHRSYTKRPALENDANGVQIAERPDDCLALKSRSNERLEFLGDGVLELIVKFYLYRRFPKADEGFMTEKKIQLVKNEHIGRLAQQMGLGKWLLLSRHAEETNTRTNVKKLGCLFEAFIGALFLDFNGVVVNDDCGWFESMFHSGPGFQMAQVFVERVLERYVDWSALIRTDDNYKNILQVRIQKAFKTTPLYMEDETCSEEGYSMSVYLLVGALPHQVSPSSAVRFEDFGTFNSIHEHLQQTKMVFIRLGTAKHRIKKKAEQSACKSALQTLGDEGSYPEESASY